MFMTHTVDSPGLNQALTGTSVLSLKFRNAPWRTAAFQFIVNLPSISARRSYFKDQDMPRVSRIAILAAVLAALAVISDTAAARGGLYPVTHCGPDLAYLCPMHGYFDQPPFLYNLAIYPDCIKVLPVRTSHGIERRRVLVCG
jgi:hypothetical protein